MKPNSAKKGRIKKAEVVTLILFDILLRKGLVYWEIMQKKKKGKELRFAQIMERDV